MAEPIKNSYRAIGVMSGTSLDGLDIACCRFTKKRKWEFVIEVAHTFPYPKEWKYKLAEAPLISGEALIALDTEFGQFIGERCRELIVNKKLQKIDVISSHGHTIFHQVDRGFTCQIGNGNVIHALTGLPVVFDLRSLDVALGGQGAPLVPVGDQLLFGEYDACLNLGGIANLSLKKNKRRLAFDVCFANMGLNYLAGKANLEFDEDGRRSSIGRVDDKLLASLTSLYDRFRKKRPALSREGFEEDFQALLDNELISLDDRLRTFSESIADEISRSLPARKKGRLLVSGGGALNPLLIALLRQKLKGISVEVPVRQIVEFKEALVFALLGVLRSRGENNVLKSVTSASRDSCSGVLVGIGDQ